MLACYLIYVDTRSSILSKYTARFIIITIIIIIIIIIIISIYLGRRLSSKAQSA